MTRRTVINRLLALAERLSKIRTRYEACHFILNYLSKIISVLLLIASIVQISVFNDFLNDTVKNALAIFFIFCSLMALIIDFNSEGKENYKDAIRYLDSCLRKLSRQLDTLEGTDANSDFQQQYNDLIEVEEESNEYTHLTQYFMSGLRLKKRMQENENFIWIHHAKQRY